MAIAPLLALTLAVPLLAGAPSDAEREQLLKLKPKIERAFSDGKFDELAPHLQDDFSGTMVLKQFRTREEFQRLWGDIRDKFGKGKKFSMRSVKLNPDQIEINGDKASVKGMADCIVDTPMGPVNYQAAFESKLHKVNGQWRLGRMDAGFNPVHRLSRSLNQIVHNVWSALNLADRIRAAHPDFDQGGTTFQYK